MRFAAEEEHLYFEQFIDEHWIGKDPQLIRLGHREEYHPENQFIPSSVAEFEPRYLNILEKANGRV